MPARPIDVMGPVVYGEDGLVGVYLVR